MALIKNGRVTVVVGLVINLLFLGVKFGAFLFSFVTLFFADAVDSFVDFFVILLVVIFLRFDLRGQLSLVTKDFLEFSQWSVIIVFRVVVVLDAVQDLLYPQPRAKPLLVIIVSAVVFGGGILLALLFADEDDVVKFFIHEEELRALKEAKRLKRGDQQKRKSCKLLPMFVEALDNLLTSLITLFLGLAMQFGFIPADKIYIVDDACNIAISLLMAGIACRGIWTLTSKHQHHSKQPLLANEN